MKSTLMIPLYFSQLERLLGDDLHVFHDPFQMRTGFRIAGLRQLGESQDGAVPQIVELPDLVQDLALEDDAPAPRCLLVPPVPKMQVDMRQKLIPAERLAQIIVRPLAVAFVRRPRIGVGREHDHRDRAQRLAVLEMAQRLDPVHLG